MNGKQGTIILLGICFLPVFIIIGAIMALCGNDPFVTLKRITHNAR